LGYYAGINATNASYSNFFGYTAGNGATMHLTQTSLEMVQEEMQVVLMIQTSLVITLVMVPVVPTSQTFLDMKLV
jgi:hypothetical protein